MKRKTSIPREVACIVCEVKFITTHSQGKYCSETCRRKAWRKSWVEYNDRNKARRLAYSRKHYELVKKERLEQIKKWQRSPSGKKSRYMTDLNSKIKFPERVAARDAVRRALYLGELVRKPCEVCGVKKVEAHHDDYSQPLKVKWFCGKHHRNYRRKKIEDGTIVG